MKTVNSYVSKLSLVFFFVFMIVSSLHFESSKKFSSFIQTKSETSIESQERISKKTRWTQDGRSCAKAFIQDGESYYDCTKSKSPDGQMNNKEWCYVDTPQSGRKAWDFCKPIMDYDQVRKYNQKIHMEMTAKVNELNENIQKNILPAQETLSGLKKLKSGQEELFKKIIDLFKSIAKINKIIEKMFKTKSSYETQNDMIRDLEFKIQKLKQDKFADDDKDRESNLILDTISSKITAREEIFGTKKTQTKNCKGMMNYEDEDEGDGLVGKYFDNEIWIGSYQERRDLEIDFDWSGSSPMKGINPSNFSIKWEGYLYVPHTGDFNFIVKADGGVELIVNNEYLLRKKMNADLDDDESTKDIGTSNPVDPDKVTSEKISLEGGTKVKIALSYFHSIHTSIAEDGQTLMKLIWKSSELPAGILPKKYLYSTNDFPALKVTEFKPSDAILGRLFDNDFAFKNSDKYLIQDVPPEYFGATLLKYDSLYMKDEIYFHINTPIIVYIAYISHYPNPLPPEFENTGMVISLLEIDKATKGNSRKIVSKNSATLVVYKNNYALGDVNIKLHKVGINKSGVPLVLFYGFDPKASIPLSCLGNSQNISISTGLTFKKCLASSEKNGMNCEAGFSGLMRDEEGAMWASKNEGIGAWIEVYFKGLFEIRKFAYKNKKNPSERNKILILVFSNGRSQIVNLKNTDEMLEFKVEPVRTTTVKITIKDVYGTINNGGSFDFYGVNCVEINKDSANTNFIPDLPIYKDILSEIVNHDFTPFFFRDSNKPVALDCRESLSNSHKFESISTSPGSRIKFLCPESCASTDAPVYGGANSHYSKDSAICKAAYHSGEISTKGGSAVLVINAPEENLREETKNGIKTEGRLWTSLAINFEKLKKEDPIIFKLGSKVDVQLSEKEFKKGTIREIKAGNKKTLTIQLESEHPITVEYPDKKILPCGTHFKERDCRGSLKRLISKIPIKIRFVPKDYSTNGEYLPDFGEIYGKTGKPFGFSRDMSHRIFNRGINTTPEKETFVEFPPAPLSRFCNKPNPESNCEPVVWSIWVGTGKFKIKLTSGDVRSEIVADFALNGKTIARNLIVPKNKLHVITEIVESKAGFIHLTSECKEKCEFSMAKLNAVEIEPFEEGQKDDDKSAKEKKLDCGMAFEQGRCDLGPDVLHCIFNDMTKPSSAFCSGENSLVLVPPDYKCKYQIGKYKCVKINYTNEEECNKCCPKKCKDSKCVY